jgi:GH15 family glucan-1,4-alpha-glucosidase
MQGRVDEARALFEDLVSYAGRLGLFSEEIDANSSVALGNYPQAFTHIALGAGVRRDSAAPVRIC